MTDNKALRVGVAGLGTVGGGVLKILTQHAEAIAARAGRPIEVAAVSARNRQKDRGVDVSAIEWVDDPVAMARRDDIAAVIEVIGGADGPAKAAAEAALDRGGHLVTANKAMLAHHGADLAARAEASGAALRFEAAVAGGIPVIKALAEGLAANEMTRVYGVLNGTCNFILTEMERTGRDYGDILAQAQELGYAESDPSADVGGFDAAQKLSLLASLAFGVAPDYAAISIEGIERVSAPDIQFARDLGYRVKLIGVAKQVGDAILQRVAPCLMPATSLIGGVDGVTNAVVCDGDFIGQTAYVGPGAGEGPTASAIVADLIDIARGDQRPALGRPAASLTALKRAETADLSARYYLRLTLVDEPGALAKVAGCFGDEGVSIDQMRQIGRAPDPATVLIVTHDTLDRSLRATLEAVASLGVCLETPVALRIEDA